MPEEAGIAYVPVWLIEVRMIEQIEELRSNSPLSLLPAPNPNALSHAEVDIKEPRSVELVASLRAESGRHLLNGGGKLRFLEAGMLWSAAGRVGRAQEVSVHISAVAEFA